MRLLRACFTKPPEIGYKLARDTLYMRYGQTHMVTSAYLKELTGGPPLRENNERDLFQLSTTMQNAHATLVELNVAGELETDSTLKGVYARLPKKLREAYDDVAREIFSKKMIPRFVDLMEFVTNRSLHHTTIYGEVNLSLDSQR